MGTDNLKLLGALVARSTAAPAFEKPIEDLIRAACAELDKHPKLENKQYKLWKKAGQPTFRSID